LGMHLEPHPFPTRRSSDLTDELFSTFMLRRKGVETQRLFEWFDNIRSQTEPEYQELLERMRRELQVDKVEPWDLEFYFSARTDEDRKSTRLNSSHQIISYA